MKNSFRLSVLAFLCCTLVYACGRENPLLNMDIDDSIYTPENQDTVPDTPEPRQQGTCTIMWNGLPVDIGTVTLTQDSEHERLLVVKAAHTSGNGVATLPRFVIRLWYDDTYGLLVAGEYLFNGQNGTSTPGQELYPSEAYIATALPDGHGGEKGDYQWAWTNSENYSTYDPETLTANLNVEMTFVEEVTYRNLVENEGAPATRADYESMVRRSHPKVMRLQLNNCYFTPENDNK